MVPRPRCVDVTRCGASTFFGKVSKTGLTLVGKFYTDANLYGPPPQR
jgi:hypothetical protein